MFLTCLEEDKMVYDYRIIHTTSWRTFTLCYRYTFMALVVGRYMKGCLPEEVMKPEKNMTSEGKQQGP